HMLSDTSCRDNDGARKLLHLDVRLHGTDLTGSASQTVIPAGASTETMNGTVKGEKHEQSAQLNVHFPGLTPAASVALTRTSANAFTMAVNTLGSTLMDVHFKRTSH